MSPRLSLPTLIPGNIPSLSSPLHSHSGLAGGAGGNSFPTNWRPHTEVSGLSRAVHTVLLHSASPPSRPCRQEVVPSGSPKRLRGCSLRPSAMLPIAAEMPCPSYGRLILLRAFHLPPGGHSFSTTFQHLLLSSLSFLSTIRHIQISPNLIRNPPQP